MIMLAIMQGIHEFLLPDFVLKERDELRKARIEREKKEVAERLTRCEDWRPDMPWKREMSLTAQSYRALNLFPEVQPRKPPLNPNDVQPGRYAESPSGTWRYTVNTLPKGEKLHTWCGSKIWTVLFDGPVNIPAIYRRDNLWEEKKLYDKNPWMSITPAEVMSMRTGLRFAKGHTIVAGLGLGHLLINVTQKKSVKKVTLVEINQDLVDWIYPRVKPHLEMAVEVIVGDARKVIPGLEADVALIDIDSKYGNNRFRAPTQHIGKVWVWGSAKHKGSYDYW
jgi:hypothetical protein